MDDGRAYGRATGESDPDLYETSPGTPAGELLRRYWQPVALSSEATSVPRNVRLLSEDLVLYRSHDGTPGLLEPRCRHRGTSLFFGRVEQDCIRCPYHGWAFGADGTCVDQPCEPRGGRHRDSHRQPWYPLHEFGGLIFTYMGPPDRQPTFPRYDIFEALGADEELHVVDHFAFGGPSVAPCNWFQTHENVMDPYHVFILHNAMSGPQFDPRLGTWPDVDWNQHELGVTSTQDRLLDDGTTLHRVTETRFPNIRVVATPTLAYLGKTNNMSWAQPIDDTHTRVFCILRIPKGAPPQGLGTYGPDAKSWFDLTDAEHQSYPGDYETQVSQGAITLHSEERLSSTDRGVSMVRRQWKQQLQVVADGGDPVGVVFDEADPIELLAGNYIVEAR